MVFFSFYCNYFFEHSSSTVLSSTASVFTFIFAIIWGDETFNKWKLFGILMAIFGSLLTSMHDAADNYSKNEEGDPSLFIPFESQLWGDLAGLISAVGEYCGDEVLVLSFYLHLLVC